MLVCEGRLPRRRPKRKFYCVCLLKIANGVCSNIWFVCLVVVVVVVVVLSIVKRIISVLRGNVLRL